MIIDIINWSGFIYAVLLLASHIFVLAGLAVVFGNEKKNTLNKEITNKKISVIIPAKDEAEKSSRSFYLS